MDVIMCHALKCLPTELYEQDAEWVEWYYKFVGYLAESGNQPVGDEGTMNEAQMAVANALMNST